MQAIMIFERAQSVVNIIFPLTIVISSCLQVNQTYSFSFII